MLKGGGGALKKQTVLPPPLAALRDDINKFCENCARILTVINITVTCICSQFEVYVVAAFFGKNVSFVPECARVGLVENDSIVL